MREWENERMEEKKTEQGIENKSRDEREGTWRSRTAKDIKNNKKTKKTSNFLLGGKRSRIFSFEKFLSTFLRRLWKRSVFRPPPPQPTFPPSPLHAKQTNHPNLQPTQGNFLKRKVGTDTRQNKKKTSTKFVALCVVGFVAPSTAVFWTRVCAAPYVVSCCFIT